MFYADFIPTVSGLPPTIKDRKNRTWLIVGITVPVVIFGLVLVFAVFYMRRKSDSDVDEGNSISLLNQYLQYHFLLMNAKTCITFYQFSCFHLVLPLFYFCPSKMNILILFNYWFLQFLPWKWQEIHHMIKTSGHLDTLNSTYVHAKFIY